MEMEKKKELSHSSAEALNEQPYMELFSMYSETF